MKLTVQSVLVLLDTLKEYGKVDRYLFVILAIYLLLTAPLIPVATSNSRMLASLHDDEPALTMALDAMTVAPYGNPANHFHGNAKRKPTPAYWHDIGYCLFAYYGGFYLDLGLVVFWPLKLLGVPTFPCAPIILRSVSFLAALLLLVLLYNFGKRHSSPLAATLGSVLLLTDRHFVYYATLIHPDALQACLALLALIVAVRHVEKGDWASLAVLGALAGLVHGTKVGGPWLAPMLLLATHWGWRRTRAPKPSRWHYLARFTLLGSCALLFFFLSTPYAFVDAYYKDSLRAAWNVVTTSVSSPINFLTWMKALPAQEGWPLTAAMILALLSLVVRQVRGRHNDALILAAVLALSNMVWYSLLGRLWISIGYWLPAFCVLFILTGDLLNVVAARLARAPAGQWLRFTTVAVVLMYLVHGRWFGVAYGVLDRLNFDHHTNFVVNHWATDHVPPESRILFDNLAYLDPEIFARQKMHGGVLKYADLLLQEPDYFVLCSSIFDAPWYQHLRQTQNCSPLDPEPFSVRLYQDLLDRRVNPDALGPTEFPGIDLVAVITPSYTGAKNRWDHVWKMLRARGDSAWELTVGEKFMVYRLRRGHGAFGPISGGDLEVYRALYAFGYPGSAWNSSQQGQAAAGTAFIGYDYGEQRCVAVRRLRILWLVPDSTPSAIKVQHSDDGAVWTDCARLTTNCTKKAEAFDLPAAGAHRYWRVLADAAPRFAFGVDELQFLE